ncbi:LamG domain-containing protein [Planktothrix pseudagardhii]|uniref:LamG-like jellyroll fold domain-containing protein n=1 Tax=Planktothrix pseudagardhii TaxID=132604 RepID=A0A9W4G3Y1_9CYAN|nr:LamG domain-containing protein [Planktothrix pseudagardhii]CAD5925087.1 hypothetical protein NO713_00917 [Planktothrix pseudagardhii]
MTTSNFQTSLLCFDGVDDYVEIQYQTQLNPPTFTVEAWVLDLSIPDTNLGIITSAPSIKSSSNRGYYDFVEQTGRSFFALHVPGGSNNAEVNNSLPKNVWIHLAGTYDPATKRQLFYINGKLVKSYTSSYKPEPPESANIYNLLRLGTGIIDRSGFGGNFKGYIDEVRIWNIVRTEQQIQESFNKPLTGKEPNLVGYWHLSNLSGNKVPDLTGNGLDGIIYGNATSQLIDHSPFTTPQPEKTKTFDVDINSTSGTPFKNDFQQEVSFKISATGTWKPATWADCTPAGWPGFEYQSQMKYPNNTSFALLVVDADTNTVLAELGSEITLVLKPSQTITFVVNDVPVNDGYQDNTGHLSITSVAQIP